MSGADDSHGKGPARYGLAMGALARDFVDAVSERGAKPMVLVFWASACGQCVAEIPHVNELAKSLGTRAIVLGVSFYVDNLKKSYNTARKHGVGYPIVLDTDKAASEALKVDIVPIVLLADKAGVIRYRDDSVPSNAEKLLGL